jgi:hypothetical protein
MILGCFARLQIAVWNNDSQDSGTMQSPVP